MRQFYLIDGHIELSFYWHKKPKAYSCNSYPYKNISTLSSYWRGWLQFRYFQVTFKYIWKRRVFLFYYSLNVR